MKKTLVIIEIIVIAGSILDVVLKITDSFNSEQAKMTIGIIIKLLGIVSFIALLSQLAYESYKYNKRINALKDWYELRISWLETNAKTHYLEAFMEIEKILKALIDKGIFSDYKIGSDPRIDIITEQFRSELNKSLNQLNKAFNEKPNTEMFNKINKIDKQ